MHGHRHNALPRTSFLALLVLLFVSFAALTAQAAPNPCSDSFGYTCRDETSNFIPVSTVPLSLTGDDVSLLVALPFQFRYYGQNYSNVNVSTNGNISFLHASTGFGNPSIPSSSAPNALISPYWDDLNVTGGAAVKAETRGTTPNRQFVIEWNNIGYFSGTNRVSFQAILHENGEILFQYADINAGDGVERGNSATIGIEDHTGTIGILYSLNTAVVTDALAVRFLPPAIDATGPAITITTPPNGAQYLLNAAVNASYSCADPAGVASCAGPVANGAPVNTATVGSKPFTVSAADTLGNTSSTTNSYDVVYNFAGFFPPVDIGTGPDRILNQTKAGSSVPLKFSLGGYQGMDIFAPGAPASKPVSCLEGTGIDPLEEIATPGSSGLTYAAGSDRYQYVWKTEKSWSGTCRSLVLTLIDGTQRVAYFQFK